MKKISSLIVATSVMVLFVCCNKSQNDNNDITSTTTGSSFEFSNEENVPTLSDKDLWLRVNYSSLKSNISKQLVDAYNAAVVQNSIISDLETYIRFYQPINTKKAIESIDVTKVKDRETSNKLNAYKKEILHYYDYPFDGEFFDLLYDPWGDKNKLFDYLSKRYNISKFGSLNEDEYFNAYNNCPSVPDWTELKERRGKYKLISILRSKYKNAKDFDARCIYAIELSHAYETYWDEWQDPNFQNPAIPIMESLMNEKKYSLYLYEIWLKWRVLSQNSKGDSKDSEIPHQFYNEFRNICACTILTYIEENPKDILAINEFLMLASKENFSRYGFTFGNDNLIDRVNLFPDSRSCGKLRW